MTIPTLENQRVMLSPLKLEQAETLLSIASQHNLVQYSPSNIAALPDLKNYIKIALKQNIEASCIPFIIYDKSVGKYAGSTRFMNIDSYNKVLHIGSTWIGQEFHGTGLNAEMKKLMLNYAFDDLKFEKVEFRVDERNVKSRKAIEKLGAVLEGILRKNVYLLDGFKRNTCCYGILKEEYIMDKKS
ncbi:MAG: GNAT family protein [Leeuwenhoekiella sp.]